MIRVNRKAANIVCCLFFFLALCYGESRTYYREKGVSLALVPDTNLGKTIGAEWNRDKTAEPVFIGEAYYEFQKQPDSHAVVSRIVRAFSTMQGIEYYSNMKKKNMVLYPQSYTIDGPQTKKRIPDDFSGSLNGKTLWMFQEDSGLGSSVYKISYAESGNEIKMNMVNQQPLYIGFIKSVKPECLYMSLLITEYEDKISIYILAQADVVSVPLIDQYVSKSFTSRLEAISEWFRSQYKN